MKYTKNQIAEMKTAVLLTTVVVCCIRGGYAYIAHVGDSRAYICRNGALTQINILTIHMSMPL